MEGTPPSTRFRHTGCPITAGPKSALWTVVSEALGPGADAAAGQLLLMFGGYNTMGEEFGADSTFVSTLTTTQETVVFAASSSSCRPSPPFYSCITVCVADHG